MADLLETLRASLAGRYAVERELGRGGMATVFLAEDVKHERPVAIKVLRHEFAASLGSDRFLREIKLAAGLRHPHILPLHDSGEAEGFLYYVMPFVEGESLRARLDRQKQLPLEDAVHIAREVADALAYAHDHGVIHRDIKPENILFEAGHAVVSDFGIARAITEAGRDSLTETGLVVGTPAYMSPEQAAGDTELDGRSDLYSLACVLYEMLAGEPPYTGSTAQAIMAKRFMDPVPRLRMIRDSVSSELEAAIARALSKAPADRFATAAQFTEALATVRFAPMAERRAKSGRQFAPTPKSIAVLPFANLSADPENEYFTDGMTEEIINALTKVDELRVASRTSAFAFKGKDQDIRKIGEQLNVSTVLEGSVRKAGPRLRITAQLVDVADGYHLWSERYDREMVDIFAIQDEISRAIVGALKVKLAGGRGASLVNRHTDDLDAYHLYLKGRYFWNQRGEGLTRGLECFERALDKDPGYALAHAGLGDCYNLLGWYSLLAPKESFPRAEAAATRALEIDDTLAEAHTSLAFAKTFYDWAWADAESEFSRAMELNPGYATAHQWYSEYLAATGRLEEALDEAQRAQALDPLGLIINTLLGQACYFGRRYDRAIAECRRTIEMGPTFLPAHIYLGLGLEQNGMHADAIEVFQKARGLPGGRSVVTPLLGHAYALSGKRRDARRILDELRGLSKSTYVSSLGIAQVYLGLGQKDQALQWLERAYEERACWLTWLRVDPVFDEVRMELRFKELLTRMRLG